MTPTSAGSRTPRHTVHLRFGGADVRCTGQQLADVVQFVADRTPGVVWWAADVVVVGREQLSAAGPDPVRLGTTEELVATSREGAQFVSAVFCAVDAEVERPAFREGGLYSEDLDDSELGDALVEIRAFDCSWVAVATNDDGLAQQLVDRFG